jgi:hypothetical protein
LHDRQRLLDRRFLKKNETPIAEIKMEIRGASLKGLYAAFSIVIPVNTVNPMEIMTASHQRREKIPTPKKTKYAASIIMSP